MDGHNRLEILKDLGKKEAWCEIWELSQAQADLVLATLNRLRGIDDIKKRANLIGKLYDDWEGDKEILEHLLPESERAIESLLKIADKEIDDIVGELEGERGLIEERLSQVLEPDMAKKLANLSKYDNPEKLKLTFEFENDLDYYKASRYFGYKPNVKKLLELLDG